MPTKYVPHPRPPAAERFWKHVNKDSANGCWLWMRSLNAKGYGKFGLNSSWVMAHRFSYELTNGPIPEGVTLDHLCRVTNCVNPEHLEAVSNALNLQRAGAAVTVCPRGHAYDQANTYLDSKGHRACKECHRLAQRKH